MWGWRVLRRKGFMNFDVDPSDGAHPTLELEPPDVGQPHPGAVAYGKIFAHYAAHSFFVSDTQLLDEAEKVAHLPVELVVGRYDCCCPPNNAYDLAQRLPLCNLVVVPGAGHKVTEVHTLPVAASSRALPVRDACACCGKTKRERRGVPWQVALGLPCAAAPERLRLRILSVQALAAEQARWEDECEDLVSPSNAKAAKIVRPTPPHLRSRHLRGDCLGGFFFR